MIAAGYYPLKKGFQLLLEELSLTRSIKLLDNRLVEVIVRCTELDKKRQVNLAEFIERYVEAYGTASTTVTREE